MPQLNHKPWIIILFFSWVIFLSIIPTNVINYIQANHPAVIDTELHYNNMWKWPW
uniref:ATP synthase complex subunit 8 n=1 Tax=Danio albolineatus TaxID=27699 RepID=A0A140E9Z1_9TELE|nr:ATP synthase F0 subunit 8 [Danio albolineatus]AMK97354.1 ATPase subunit 8 [Danio albolineatus]